MSATKTCWRVPVAMRLLALSTASLSKCTDACRAVEYAAAAGRHLALLLVGDHFKGFNDRFGIAAGDVILKRIVLDVIATVRMSDFTYRFGGEEFVVIADGLNVDDAWALGERIRRRVAAGRSEAEGRLTVNIVRATAETTKRALRDCR